MRVEISTSPVTPTSNGVAGSGAENAPNVTVNLIHHNQNAMSNAADGAAKGPQTAGHHQQVRHSYVSPPSAIPPPTKYGYQRSVSSDMIPSNLNSIVSANVVGLPNHPRHVSVPCSAATQRSSVGNGFIFPNHPRNSSEPSAMVQQPVVVSHTRNGSTPSTLMTTSNSVRNAAPTGAGIRSAAVAPSNITISQPSPPTTGNISCANIVSILSHHRHSSHVSSTDVIPTFATRSVSVPKVPSILGFGESSINTTTLNIPPNSQQSRIPVNISSVDVVSSFYRAVPVTVVSNVPTIQCINNAVDPGNNVSNVNIVQAMSPPLSLGANTSNQSANTPAVISAPPSNRIIQVRSTPHGGGNGNGGGISGTTQVTVHNDHAEEPPQQEVRTRTFTSTEAQTDDISVASALVRNTDRIVSREQRRRERRERRHLRRVNNGNHQHGTVAARVGHTDRLPDLLNSHMPPPYSPNHGNHNGVPSSAASNLMHNPLVPGTVVPNSVVPSGVVASHIVPFPPPVVSGQVPLVQGAGPVAVPVAAPSGFRFQFPSTGFRRSRYSEEPPKSCCGLLAWKPGSLRWFIALIAVVAVCCVLVGTALGAMRPAGRDHLTVSLLMIGVGIVLVTVSGVAWRLTSHDSSTCRAMLGLGSTESVDVCPRRFVPRLPPSYGRPHHPYAAMIYPEFQYRPPPPSYQASMQEYRLRLLLLDRGNTPQIQAGVQNGPSPPPTYRSYAGSLLRAPLSNRRDATQSEYSFPPSYRSQTGSTRPATTDMQTSVIIHSREQSLSLSESNQGSSLVNSANILTTADEDIALDNITIDSLKMAPDSEINPVKMLLKGSCSDLEGNKEGNLVTIVQTSDQNPVIVTVSGCSQTDSGSTVQITEIPTEMEILAHL